jgi:serine/threonine protein kinase
VQLPGVIVPPLRRHGSVPPEPLEPEAEGGNALPVGTRLGEFEVRSVIGEGGFSIVYQVWDHSLHRNVALKEYIPAELAMRDSALRVTARSRRQRETFEVGLKSFINEARLLASFDHQSLVKVFRFWEERGTAFMVMPWYQGPTLKQELAAGRTLVDEAWLLRLLDPLTEGLAVLHSQQCYHRDIAPDNIILLGSAKTPLLLDFGAARRVIGSLTHDLTAILKRGYAPLEQYGEIPDMHQGPWTDVYAVAAVVHFAIRGITPPPAVARLVNDTFKPLALSGLDGYSQTFLKAIDQALAVRPDHRTRSIADFRNQLGFDRPRAESAAPEPAKRAASSANPPVRVPQRVRAAVSSATAGKRRELWLPLAAAGLAVLGAGGYEWHLFNSASAGSGASAPGPVVPAVPPVITAAAPVAPPFKPEIEAAHAASSVPSKVAAADPYKALDLKAGQERDAALSDLVTLARTEKRDVAPALRAVREKQAQAQAESRAERFQQALAFDLESKRLTIAALNELVTDLVGRYSKVAEQATSAGQLEIAQQALSRAKKVDALKRTEVVAEQK